MNHFTKIKKNLLAKSVKRAFVLALCFLPICACNNSSELKSQINTQVTNFDLVTKQKLPNKLEWCGEKVPLDDDEVRERAEREFYLLLQQPGQVYLYMKRAGKYFPTFEKVLKETGVPDDLKYLAVAESALFMSRSSKGALGFWQFMPETGKKMGLIINDNVDERRHIEKSTYAAVKYLKQGYAGTKSWFLSAAGYNMGHTGVADNLSFQQTDDYFDLFLNEETSRYIFRIAIIKEIMTNPEKYGFKIDKNEIYKAESVKKISWSRAIPDLSEWAKSQGTNYKYVKLLNPWMLERKLDAPESGSWEILIPKK